MGVPRIKIDALRSQTLKETVRLAVRKGKPRKLFDGQGLYLLVDGDSAHWRYKFFFERREHLMSLGSYPDVDLATARARHEKARKLVTARPPINPIAQQEADRAADMVAKTNTFGALTEAWLNKKAGSKKWAPGHEKRMRKLFANKLLPKLGNKPIDSISVEDLREVLHDVQERSVDTAHRALTAARAVFRFAIKKRLGKNDPSLELDDEELDEVEENKFAAITDPRGVGELLRAIEGYAGRGHSSTAIALRMLPYVFVRPGELRMADWSEFDLETEHPMWRIPPNV